MDALVVTLGSKPDVPLSGRMPAAKPVPLESVDCVISLAITGSPAVALFGCEGGIQFTF